jgi:arginine/lysine/histidine transport system permease protein
MSLHFERLGKYFYYYWEGLGITLTITGVTLILSILIAAVILIMRLSRFRILKAAAAFYISFFRGVPVIVQLFIVYFGSAAMTGNRIVFSATVASIVTFTLNTSAYLSENVRGGILGVDHGQMEAADALGIGRGRCMLAIVLPQALRSVMPAVVNTTITLLKNSSIISQIGVMDLMRSGQVIMNITYLSFEPLIVVALFYLTIILLITFLGKYAEKYLNRSEI